MAAFAAGEADVLVATTVIEVGIDVPNATVMMIENAERFGISQLHQLRGRVGRGEHESLCLLCGPKGSPRLSALARHDDGFELAEIDLRLRKEGELIGTRQSGVGQLPVRPVARRRGAAPAGARVRRSGDRRRSAAGAGGARAARRPPRRAPRRDRGAPDRGLMRVISGELGGRRLQSARGEQTRPTASRVREALFSMLGPLEGAVVLDLFAGSGALGIEALSRGAVSATFVERAPRALAALRANIEALGLGERCEIRTGDALEALRGEGQYDLVFIDPPYAAAAELGGALSRELPAVLAAGARVVSESDRRSPLELALPLARERRYGDTMIRIHETSEP